MSANWKQWFQGPTRNQEHRDTEALLDKIRQGVRRSPLRTDEAVHDFVISLGAEICDRAEVAPSGPLARMLYRTIDRLLGYDDLVVEVPDIRNIGGLTVDEGVALRRRLNRHARFLNDPDRLLSIWREKVAIVFAGVLGYFPLSAFVDIGEDGSANDDSLVLPEAPAYALCEKLGEAIWRVIATFFDDDVTNANLFEGLRERFDINALLASGIPLEDRYTTKRDVTLPTAHKNQSPEFLIEAYLGSTPFQFFFEQGLPFAIPFPARFEHTHILGGSGHGKTQLLQFLINHDLVRAAEDRRSVVVIDSQGDLIKTLSHLDYFSPEQGSLADRLVLVDPNDVEHPACLNMFDFNRDRLSGYAAVDREKILNATIELYDYFFGALLGAELTQRQGLLFRYLARLMLEIPGATIHTLRELMEDAEPFRPYMEKLPGTARSFFLTRFFDRSFSETKKQVLTRLWGVLSNSSLERMFSHKENRIDLFDLMNEGKIILINTAKELLGQEGSAIFGRFFIALIAQAAIQRAALPAYERRPSFVYIDEAQEYFDENISMLVGQARKYRVGLAFAHQNLDQLSAGVRASVLASTTIKFVGGLSAKDANALDSELRCTSDFLLSQRKGADETQFACFVRNYTRTALSVRVPLGYVESLRQMSASDYRELIEKNRERYSAPPEEPTFTVPKVPPPPPSPPRQAPKPEGPRPPPAPAAPAAGTPPPQRRAAPTPPLVPPSPPAPVALPPPIEVAPPEHGGTEHKYLQHLIKELGNERGYRATIEHEILGGQGRIDVLLTRGEEHIACEISMSTGRDWELGNIEKCFAAGFTDIVLVGKNERHVKGLSTFIEENLDEDKRGRVLYLTPERLPELMARMDAAPETAEKVRGYSVKVKRRAVSPEDAARRNSLIAGVIAKSLKKPSGSQ